MTALSLVLAGLTFFWVFEAVYLGGMIWVRRARA